MDRSGENNPRAKLTRIQVLDIRAAYLNGARTADLAGKYGVKLFAIDRILSGRSWRSVTDGVDLINQRHDNRVSRERELSWEQIQLLRHLAPYTSITHRQWGRLLGVSGASIGAILRGETYRKEVGS